MIVDDLDAAVAASWALSYPETARRFAAAFWPGPLTLVLLRSGRAADAITGGQETVALRAPAHPIMRQVLAAFGGGVDAPSEKRFGRGSPTPAVHVRAGLSHAGTPLYGT